jgi:2-polyprenyl-6-methoxyphenol hydroxylase-like FAD-dependent oxidoreductase
MARSYDAMLTGAGSHRRVTVAGAGVAGLAVALLLARRGFAVTVVERDQFVLGAAPEAGAWPRNGVPHFGQPHALLPRGRRELLQNFPDVYASMLRSGAYEVDIRSKVPGPIRPEDEDLQYVAVRRPLIEWALRTAVAAEPGITMRSGERITGVEEFGTAVVVDALGRRTPFASSTTATNDCGVVYYSRYYRQHDDFDLPDGPWSLGPRGDLGYLGFGCFPGDNRTFAALVSVPIGVPHWRILNEPAAFEAVIATIPALRAWANPAGADPITGVRAMAGMRNSLTPDRPTGMFAIGDALCHTDPSLAHGISFALAHASDLATALDEHSDPADAQAAYLDAILPEVRDRFDFISALDGQRLRMWRGDKVDIVRHDGDYALFSMAAGGAAAMLDPEVFRLFNRRVGLLDSVRVLDEDIEMRRRIEELFRQVRAMSRPPSGPDHADLLAIAQAAVQACL